MENLTEQEIEQQLIDELTKLKSAVDSIEKANDVATKSTKLLEEMNLKYEEIEISKSELKESFNDLKSGVGKYLKESVKENIDSLKSHYLIQLDRFNSELVSLKRKMVSSDELDVIRLNVQNQKTSNKSDLEQLRFDLIEENRSLRKELSSFKIISFIAFFLIFLALYIIRF